MILTLTPAEFDNLCQRSPQPSRFNLELDGFETLEELPEYLGQGYTRRIQVLPGIWLDLWDKAFHRDWQLTIPVHEHPVQCLVLLSGTLPHNGSFPTLDRHRSYLSGSGISPAFTPRYERSQRLVGVNIHFSPEVLKTYFADQLEADATLAKVVLKSNDWKVSFFPTVTPAMKQVVHQILHAPFHGVTRQWYLQGKVLELLALQLQPLMNDTSLTQASLGRKPDTVARIYHAKEILACCLEYPPSILELARQVGVSERTLRRGFHNVFGTTIIGYLRQLRMQQAEQLLREGLYSVGEVANRVGYAHLGHFAAGFRRQFGITPSECLTSHQVSSPDC